MVTTDAPFAALDRVAAVMQALASHQWIARRSINMVPSENSMSALARLPFMLDAYHRYFFNDALSSREWNFRGAQELAEVQLNETVGLARELMRAAHVNVRPISGLNAMTVVLAALGGSPGSTVMTVSEDHGGHYATSLIAERMGLRVVHMTGPDTHAIDYQAAGRLAAASRAGLVYVDQSNCLFPIDVASLVTAVRNHSDALIHIDVSHWMGLVLGGVMPNPLEAGADSFGGSTHKTFPGPHKAMIATNSEIVAQRVGAAQYYLISSHHFAATLALGIALAEFRDFGGAEYARRTVSNTRLLAAVLAERGAPPEGACRGYSAGHQLWIVPPDASAGDAFDASERLYRSGIRVNAFPGLPGIDRPVLRVGVNEPTYHGLDEVDIETLGVAMADALLDRRPYAEIRADVGRLRQKYRLAFRAPSDDPRLMGPALKLLASVLADDPGAGEPVSTFGLVDD